MTKGNPLPRLLLAVAFLLVMFGASAEAQQLASKVIRVKGANTMANPVDQLASAFMKDKPDISVAVSGGGTQIGFRSLLDGSAEIAMASAKFTSEQERAAAEKGMELVSRVVGSDGVVVAAHKDNRVNELTVEELRKIFTGDFPVWSNVGGPENLVMVYVPEMLTSGASQFLGEQVLAGAPYSLAANTRHNFRNLTCFISYLEEAIGLHLFLHGMDAQQKARVKILAVKKDQGSPAVAPSTQTIKDRSYPLTRPLYMCHDGKSGRPEIKQFVDFCAEKGFVVL